MAEIVYLDYDADTLYAEYNNRGKVEGFAELIDTWVVRSEETRQRFSGTASIDLKYGEHERETFDLFRPESGKPPLFAFIHGGYWQWNTKEEFAFLANAFVDNGFAFANIEYPLCPEVTLRELIGSVRKAFAHLWREADNLGFDRDGITVSGHSAGGHLTGIVLTTDWPAFAGDLPRNLVRGAMPISGPFDLEPLRHTPIGEPLGLDAETAAMLSPMFALPRTRAETVIALGGHEGREFHRQAEAFGEHLRRHGTTASIVSVPATHHFSVLEELASPEGQLFRAAKTLLSR